MQQIECGGSLLRDLLTVVVQPNPGSEVVVLGTARYLTSLDVGTAITEAVIRCAVPGQSPNLPRGRADLAGAPAPRVVQ